MNLFDMRTIVYSYLITNIICVWFVVQLWRQNRHRFAGTAFWVVDFVFQAVALFLIVMRGTIPDWISMVFSNTLVISGAILGFMGQERFLGKRGPQIQNYLLVILFISIHSYFALVQPNLAVRNLNIAVALLLVCFQSVWLVWRRVEPGRRSLTFGVGMVNLLYCLISSVRIAHFFVAPPVDNNYFLPAFFEALMLLSYQVLFILLTYSFVLMVNKRLIMEVGTQEEKFSKAFHSAPYAIMITRPSDGKIIEVNEKFSAISGYGRSEVLENSSIALHLWECDEDRAAVVDQLSKTGKVDGKEARFRGKNGEAIVGLFSAEILTMDGENFILSSIADITERKRAEESVQLQEIQIRTILESTGDGILAVDNDGKVLKMNRIFTDLWNIPSNLLEAGNDEALLNHVLAQLVSPQAFLEKVQALYKSGAEDLDTILCKDGRIIERHSCPILKEGVTDGRVWSFRDITSRKHAEEALLQSEANLSRAQMIAHLGSWEYDIKTGKTTWSDEAYRIFGFSPREVMVTSDLLLNMTHPEDRDRIFKGMNDLSDGSVQYDVEYRIIRRDGTERYVHSRRHVSEEGEDPGKIFGMVQDITERKKAEQETATVAKIGRLIGSTLDIDEVYEQFAVETGKLIPCDRLAVNLHTANQENVMVGYAFGEKIPGRLKGDLFPLKDSACEILTKTRSGLCSTLKHREETDNLSSMHPSVKAGMRSLLRVPLIYRNDVIGSLHFGSKLQDTYNDKNLLVAERIGAQIAGAVGSSILFQEFKDSEAAKRGLEERLNRAEKMEALGTLAGGVAHDLNNVLGIIVGYAEMVIEGTDKSSPNRKSLENIMNGGLKAAAIVEDLLTLARRGVQGRAVLNINTIITDCQTSPEFTKLSSHHPSVNIITDLETDLLNISGSAVHMGKSLYNLISNASEAMPKGGTVTIKTTNQYLDKPVQGYDQIQQGDYVILSVSDTGYGIPEADLKRIFEPFYTKKIMGRSGTGLGLAVVWGTVKDHNGYHWCPNVDF